MQQQAILTIGIAGPQVRRQIAIPEEAHRQNPLPVKVTQWP